MGLTFRVGPQHTYFLVFSFDIDGTLENGDPPGTIKLDDIREYASKKHIVLGSCSQNEIWEQEQTWKEIGAEPDFMIQKDERLLMLVKNRWPDAWVYLHVGDWVGLDDVIAEKAGWEFQLV